MLTLKINIPERSVTRALRFNRTLSVHDTILDITEKTGCGGSDHGLFQAADEDGKHPNRYLLPQKSLGFYDLRNDDEIVFRKKTRAQKIKTIDENVRTIWVDDSKPAASIVETMCGRLNIKNWEEFSLQREAATGVGAWVASNKSLYEQNIPEDCLLIIKKRFFATDDQIDTSNPMDVHLVFLQLKGAIQDGLYPCQKDEAILLASMHAQVELRDYDPGKWDAKKLKNELIRFIPPRWIKAKKITDDVLSQYKQLRGIAEVQAKFRYIQLARSLKTYGLTIFNIIYMMKELLLGIKKDEIQLMNPENYEVIKAYHLNHIKRWGATERSVTIDFGEYDDKLFKFECQCAGDVASLIAGYVDIALKRRTDTKITEDSAGVQTPEVSTLPTMYQVGKKKQGTTRLMYNSAGTFDVSSGAKKVQAVTVATAQKVPAEDIPTAIKAATALADELAAAPAPASRSSGLAASQWRSQLGTAFNALGGDVEEFMKLMNAKPMARTSIVPMVKQMMIHANEMGSSAKFAIPEGNSPVSLLEASKLVTSAMAGILKVAEDCEDGKPLTPEQMNAMKIAQAKYTASVAYMNAALTGKGVVDKPSLTLLEEYGRTLVDSAEQLLEAATTETVNFDADKRTAIIEQANVVKQFAYSTQNAVGTFGSAVLVPLCRTQVIESTEPLKRELAKLLESASAVGLDASSIVQVQAQSLINSLAGLVQATACAEPIGSTNPEIVNSFAEAFTELNGPFDALKAALGNRTEVHNALKEISNSVNKVVANGRTIAAGVKDPEIRLKLERSIQNVSDIFSKLYASCQECADNPDDKNRQEAVLQIALNLQAATQDMATIAGGLAAGSNLRGFSKSLIESSLCLISASKNSLKYLPESQRDLIMKPAAVLAAATQQILDATLASVKDPFSTPLQQKMLAASQKSCIPAMTMVVAALKAAPKIKNFTAKQNLISQAEKAKQAAQALMKAIQAFKDLTGQSAVEEVTELLASTMADLDALQATVQNNSLEKIPERHAHDDAMALLNLSAKTLISDAGFVTGSARDEPRMLATRCRATTSSAVQVMTAIKALVPTLADKQQQLRLTATAKQLGMATAELLNAAQSVAARSTPEGVQAMEQALEKVKTSVHELTSSYSHLHDIEEAINTVKVQVALLKPAQNVDIPLSVAIERVVTCAKALSAGMSQVATIVQTNPEAVGAAVKAMSATVPGLVEATNIAAGATKDAKAQEDIMKNTRNLLNQYGTALTVAKKQTGKSAMDTSLLDAAKGVANSLNRLMRTFGAVSNRDCEEALEAISEASQDLGNFSGVTHISPSAAVREFAGISKNLSENTVALVTKARTNPDATTTHARGISNNIRQLVDVTRAMVAPEETRLPENLIGPSNQLKASIAKLIEAKDAPAQMVAAVKGIQESMNSLIALEKEAEKTANGEKLAALKRRAENLNKGLTNIARVTKLAASGDPAGKAQLKQVGEEFQDAAEKLIGEFTIHSGSNEALAADKAEKVVQTVKELCTVTTQLIFSAMSVSAKPTDKDLQGTLTEHGMIVSETVKKFQKLGSSTIAGAEQIEQCQESLKGVISDVASASMAVAVGTINDNPAELPHQKLQELLVQQAKVVMNSLGQVQASASLTTAAVARSAQECTAAVKQACVLAIQAASTSPDVDLQNDLVSKAQALAESTLQLVQNSFTCACNPSPEALKAVSDSTQAASDAIGTMASKLSAGASILQDVDEALKSMEKAMSDSTSAASAPPPQGLTYQHCKDEITTVCKSITAGAKALLASDKSNLVQMGNTVKVVADLCHNLVQQSKFAAALAPEPQIATDLKAQCATVVKATHAILQTVQEMAMDPKNPVLISKLNDSFKAMTTTTGALLTTAKRGAKGEAVFEESLELLKQALAELDRAALFASAGQLDESTSAAISAPATPAGPPTPATPATPAGPPKPANPNDCINALRNTARNFMMARGKVIDATKLTDIAVSDACKAFAIAFLQLSKDTIACACQIKDMSAQQELVSAGKAACIACQALAITSRDAQRLKNDQSQDSLASCNQNVSDSLTQLVRIAQTTLTDLARGSRNLETARANVSNLAARYATLDGNAEAQPKNIVEDARNIIAACSTLGSGIASNDQDEIGRAAGFLSAAATNLLRNAKGVHRLNPPPGVAQKLDNAVLESVRHIQLVLAASTATAAAPENEKSAKKAIMEQNSNALVQSLQGIEQAIKQYPGGETLSIQEEEREATDLEAIAENELTRCAQAISEAAEKLLASRPVVVRQAGVKLNDAEINAIIMDGAHAIAVSCTDLVRNAALSQATRLQNLKTSTRYRADPTWSNGLISAAQKVVRTVQELIGAANKPKPVEEELIATARAVAASTAHLVTASRVKAEDLNSKDQLALSAAAKSVVNTTVQLVSSAKKALTPQEDDTNTNTAGLSFVAARNREIEMQIEMQKLEEQLRKTRTEMLKARQGAYTKPAGKP